MFARAIHLATLSFFATTCLIASQLDTVAAAFLLPIGGCFSLLGFCLLSALHVPSALPAPRLFDSTVE